MDTRAVQTHAYDQHHHDSHNLDSQEVAHGPEEHQHDHEKKSVLKKVKQKAKKIKDTITKHGHNDHEHGREYHYEDQHIPDDHDLDEEDDVDEDMVEDPEVHGAPIYDSATVKSAAPQKVHTSGRPGNSFGGTGVTGGVVVVTPTTGINENRFTDPTRTLVGGGKAMEPKVNLGRPMDLKEDPNAQGSRHEAYAPANYQIKVTDPTGEGGAEIDTIPIENSLTRMTVNQPNLNPVPNVLPHVTETHYPSVGSYPQFEPELSTPTKTRYPSAESYGQYTPELSSEIKTQYPKSHNQFISELPTSTNTQYPSVKSHNHDQYSATNTQHPSTGSHDQFVQDLSTQPKSQYPSATSHNQQSSATKTQYPSTGSHDQFVQELFDQSKRQYPSAISRDQRSSATKTPSTGSHDQFLPELSAKPNTQYTSVGAHDQFQPELSALPKSTQTYNTTPSTTLVEEQSQQPSNQNSYTDKISSATSAIADKAITAKNAVASKLGYGEKGDTYKNETTQTSTENPSNQTSYTEKISSATSAIADKAVSAKNTVASKLGFGDKGNTEDNVTTTEEKKDENNASSPTEYGKRVALSLTEKLAPVYGKVAGVGSAAKSKVPGTGTENSIVGVEQDKGVSVKDYLVEKLRPSDEDKALSEVISETLYKKEQNTEEEEDTAARKVVSDAVHKREEEPERGVKHNRPLGKVTESEEVTRRLGVEDKETEKRNEESYVNSPSKGVVDKLKGVVGSWFSKPGENQSSQEGEDLSKNYGTEVKQVNQGAGERRLQESSN